MSVALANAAKARVWHFWGAHIPAALRNVPASEIFNFHESMFVALLNGLDRQSVGDRPSHP